LKFGFLFLFSIHESLKLGNRAIGKEISDVPFRTEKEDYLWSRESTILERIVRKNTVPFDFQPEFPDFSANGKHPQNPSFDFR